MAEDDQEPTCDIEIEVMLESERALPVVRPDTFASTEEVPALPRPITLDEGAYVLESVSSFEAAPPITVEDPFEDVSKPPPSPPLRPYKPTAARPVAPLDSTLVDEPLSALVHDVARTSETYTAFLPTPSLVSPALDMSRDEEEAELVERKRFGPLIALYRQRLLDSTAPLARATLLLKTALAYEEGLGDPNEALEHAYEAFARAPAVPEIVAAIERIAQATERLESLAERVQKNLANGGPDELRAEFLGHVVSWYERLPGRSREAALLLEDLERRDPTHPAALKKAAQVALRNNESEQARALLLRALDRTIRPEDQVSLHLALAEFSDAVRHYHAALKLNPQCSDALRGIERHAREQGELGHVRWALEQLLVVAASDDERAHALVALAEFEETQCLRHAEAAALLEEALTKTSDNFGAWRALERCYYALSDWPKLASTLSRRASREADAATKFALLERASEVAELRLGDVAGALMHTQAALDVDPYHTPALVNAARLSEQYGDLASFVSYKSRLAAMAHAPREHSDALVELAALLDGRDNAAALRQFERAVEVDPTNTRAWEAFQSFAVEMGDAEQELACLRQRALHTEPPRRRAIVLVELARMLESRGHTAGAFEAYEQAILIDPSNQDACAVVLDAYVMQERWAEAVPLCELLVNVALRSGASDTLFARLLLATRIATAIGNIEAAMTSALAAFGERPEHADARADLIATAARAVDSPNVLARAKDPLAALARDVGGLPQVQLVALALVQKALGDFGSAAELLERVRAMAPEDRDVVHALSDVYVANGDYPRASKLKVELANTTRDPDAKFTLLCEASDVWARHAGDLEKAVALYEEAIALRPLDPRLLKTLMRVYRSLKRWEPLADVLGRMARSEHVSAGAKLKSLMALAEVAREKLGDVARAADVTDELLDLDPSRHALFDELVASLTKAEQWERLAQAYTSMLNRLGERRDASRAFEIQYALGLLYRDKLEDAPRAYDALAAAAALDPEHVDVRRHMTDLLIVTDNLDSAVARIRAGIARNPHDPKLFAELYELFLRQQAFDKAWCAANVLVRLGDASPEQRQFHADYSPMPLDSVPGQLISAAWASHVFHPELDATLTKIFALVTPVFARMRFAQLPPEARHPKPLKPEHSKIHDILRATLTNVAEILSLRAPALLVGDPTDSVPFSPALSPYGALFVSVPVLESHASSLVYLAGKTLAGQRPELAARSFFPSWTDLTSLLATAVRVGRGEPASDNASSVLDKLFSATLSSHESLALRSLVLKATGSFDVERWAAAADLSAMRAGLLVAGDVAPCCDAIASEADPEDEIIRSRIGELYKFATSDVYADLRVAVGVAITP